MFKFPHLQNEQAAVWDSWSLEMDCLEGEERQAILNVEDSKPPKHLCFNLINLPIFKKYFKE